MIFPVYSDVYFDKRCYKSDNTCEDIGVVEYDVKTDKWVYWLNSKTFHLFFFKNSKTGETLVPNFIIRYPL